MTASCAIWWPSANCPPLLTMGSLPEWLMWLVTTLALAAASYAAFQAKRSSDSAKQQTEVALTAFYEDARSRAEATATKVYALLSESGMFRAGTPVLVFPRDKHWVAHDPGLINPDETFAVDVLRVCFDVQNDSDEVILLESFQLAYQDDSRSAQRVHSHPIRPGKRLALEVDIEWPGDMSFDSEVAVALLGIVPFIEFRDSAGRLWSRRGFEPIKRLESGQAGT